ncbi:hypothetical protein [Pareuzebyella sediminis]|uniref:hypothetical protein n=1 Tax=Pareuzebyella sediminis TaxID=2607998 RepID=UPI0011ECF6E7|nr:hypothetical protein [Pareuzebyella sediminis]
MKTKHLLLQISRVENLLKKFSFEELNSNEASLVQKSFVSFKQNLFLQLAKKENESGHSDNFSEVSETFIDDTFNDADQSSVILTAEIYNAIIEHFDAYTSLLESLKIDLK